MRLSVSAGSHSVDDILDAVVREVAGNMNGEIIQDTTRETSIGPRKEVKILTEDRSIIRMITFMNGDSLYSLYTMSSTW